MIARVRIAPVERWCDERRQAAQRYPAATAIVGESIAIYTSVVRTRQECNGKNWQINNASCNDLRHKMSLPPVPPEDIRFVCEHMLEMD